MYTIRNFHNLFLSIFHYVSLNHLNDKKLFFFVQHELLTTVDIVVKLYYEEVLDENLRSSSRTKALMDKVME